MVVTFLEGVEEVEEGLFRDLEGCARWLVLQCRLISSDSGSGFDRPRGRGESVNLSQGERQVSSGC